MQAFEKVIRPGSFRIAGKTRAIDVFCKIVWNGERLSITGVEGPKKNGDADGGCGQITEFVLDGLAEGWTFDLVEQFRAVWDRWHLNDMCAGSPRQREYLREHPVEVKYPDSHYDAACRALATAGLQPDTEYLYGDKPYAYGAAWLTEQVPEEVLEFLNGLPDADTQPAWV